MEDDNAPAAARVAAANAILDRGFGKPAQAVEMSGGDGTPVQVQHSATDAFLAELMRLRKRLEETELAEGED
ncbi:MAG: hypothetical protein WCD20_02605 [Rhodomicrobium sp.]